MRRLVLTLLLAAGALALAPAAAANRADFGREAGYTIGFFMLWLATASSSLFTWILLRPASRYNGPLPPE